MNYLYKKLFGEKSAKLEISPDDSTKNVNICLTKIINKAYRVEIENSKLSNLPSYQATKFTKLSSYQATNLPQFNTILYGSQCMKYLGYKVITENSSTYYFEKDNINFNTFYRDCNRCKVYWNMYTFDISNNKFHDQNIQINHSSKILDDIN